jgi:acetyl esterase/lipase
MTMFRILFVLVFLTGCSGHVDWRNTSVHSGYSLTRNINYTPPAWPARLSGDLYMPRRQSAAPAVLLVHGGGWEGGDGRWQMEPIAKQLARRGYGVFNVTYRMAPRWIYPAPVEDLQEAIQWLRSHADTYRLDPQRIAVFGYSAGGHLALLTGLLDGPRDSQVRAIVAGGAPSDLTFYPAGRLVPQFLGGTIRQIPERFKDASPVSHVKRCSPPVFIYHGTGDRLVPPEHPLALMAELTRWNVRHETYWVEGRDHIPTFLMPAGSVDAALRFLDREMR